MSKKRIAVFSIYYHNWNYGALLQSYALNHVLRSMGYEADHIRFCYAEPAPKSSALQKRIRTVLMRHRISAHCLERFFCRKERDMKNRRNFYEFHDKAIHGSLRCCDAVTASKMNQYYDIFVTGSDQVWNPEFWSDRLLRVFGLMFTEKNKKTISYAASIGSEKAAHGKEALYQEMMGAIDHISVRETAAKDYLQPLTDKPVQVVLDPTLLLSSEEWSAAAADRLAPENYIFSYFLEEKQPHNDQLFAIADVLGLPIYSISKVHDIYTRHGTDRQILDAGPREFLSYIQNADCIITNSFHGMVFSVIFHKPFWVMKRFKDTDENSMNNRITDFLREFGLEDRLLEDGDMLEEERLNQPIDYKRVDRILEKKRATSLKWLEDSLAEE